MRKPHPGSTWLRRYGLQLLLVGLCCCLTPQIDLGQPIIINRGRAVLGPPEEPEKPVPSVLEFPSAPPQPPVGILLFEPIKSALPAIPIIPSLAETDAGGASLPKTPTVPGDEATTSPLRVAYPPPLTAALDRPTFGKVIGLNGLPEQAIWISHPLTIALPSSKVQLVRFASLEEILLERQDSEARPNDSQTKPVTVQRRVWPGSTKNSVQNYLVTKRLLEQAYDERQRPNARSAQPLLSTGIFVYDTFAWPFRRLAQPLRWHPPNTIHYFPFPRLFED